MTINEPENIILETSLSTKEHLKKFFGGEVPKRKLAALVGALDESVIEITPLGDGFLSTARHKYLIEQTRIGGSAADFGFFITNEFFQLTGEAPMGTGLISFIRQVVAAKELGFAFIRTYAEGYFDDPDNYVGYYVWARFGFNAPLEEIEIDALPSELKDCADLNDLMMRGGHKWWRLNGTARDMIFSLSEDELSLRVLRNYLAEKEVETNL